VRRPISLDRASRDIDLHMLGFDFRRSKQRCHKTPETSHLHRHPNAGRPWHPRILERALRPRGGPLAAHQRSAQAPRDVTVSSEMIGTCGCLLAHDAVHCGASIRLQSKAKPTRPRWPRSAADDPKPDVGLMAFAERNLWNVRPPLHSPLTFAPVMIGVQ
jgi:hypothetical protein